MLGRVAGVSLEYGLEINATKTKWMIEKSKESTIGKGKTAFTSMRNILTRKELDLSLRMRLVWCNVMPVLLFGMES